MYDNVDVPMLMSRQRLLEARALLRRFAVPLRQQAPLARTPVGLTATILAFSIMNVSRR
jgi:hypothetical protein